MVIQGSETSTFFSFAKSKKKGQKALKANLENSKRHTQILVPVFDSVLALE